MSIFPAATSDATSASPARPASLPALPPLRGDAEDLRAMKRALACAPLGPKATLALTHAILALEQDLAPPSRAGRASSPR